MVEIIFFKNREEMYKHRNLSDFVGGSNFFFESEPYVLSIHLWLRALIELRKKSRQKEEQDNNLRCIIGHVDLYRCAF